MLDQIKKLLFGNGAAQLIQLGALIILSRLYVPADFGLLAQVQSYATVAAVIFTLQLQVVIPSSASPWAAKRTVVYIQFVSGAWLVAFLPIFLLGPYQYWVGFVLAFLIGLSTTYNYYLIYLGKFSLIAKAYILRATMIVAIQLLLYPLHNINGLLWGAVIAEAISLVFLTWLTHPISISTRISIKKVWRYIFINRAFTLYGVLQEVAAIFCFYAPMFLFVYRLGEDVGGQYAMASRLVWAPVVLISSSIAQVYYHRVGSLLSNRSQRLEINVLFNPKFFAVVVLACIVPYFLKDLYGLILGEGWDLAAQLIPMQLTWGGIFVLSTPFRVAGKVMQLQRLQLCIDLFVYVLIIALFFLLNLSPIQTMFGLIIIALIQHLGTCVLVAKQINRYFINYKTSE